MRAVSPGTRQRLMSGVIIGLGFGVSFLAGFLVHRSGLHDYAQPLLAYARRDTGGCGLREAYSALHPAAFTTALQRLRSSGRVVERTPDGLRRVTTEQGTFWAPAGTDWAFVLAEQTIRIYGDGPFRVQPGDVVLDAGANIGAFTREALNAGAKLVVAIEPVPSNVESLRRTFEAEIHQGRVRLVAKGVWNKEDTLEMNLFENSALDSFVLADRPEERHAGRRVALPLTTIDRMVDQLGLARVDFIKMDIEGAERQALDGARQTITRFKPRMSIATENLLDDYEAIPDVIAGMDDGYRWTTGRCEFKGRSTLRPVVLFFQQP